MRPPGYHIWAAMIQRCTNPNCAAFPHYGGRGIEVCPRWRASFAAFAEDIGERPSRLHTIERKDNNGPYAPHNCRWATRAEQGRNQRSNRMIDTPAGRMFLCDAANTSGLKIQILWKRLNRGWSTADLFLPLGTYTKTRQGKPLAQHERSK